jgi:hypothetical protein
VAEIRLPNNSELFRPEGDQSMPGDDLLSSGVDPASPPDALKAQPAPAVWKITLWNWTVILGLAVLAGIASWHWGEVVLDYFKPSEKVSASRQMFVALNKEMAHANALNGALAFGALGGFLALALGLAGGLTRMSPRSAIKGAIVGLFVGGLAGALPSFGLMPFQWYHRNDDENNVLLLMPLLIHMGLWAGVGLASGLAFGVGRYGPIRSRLIEAALAGLVGAMLGTFVFEILGALLMPSAETTKPIAEAAGARLLARICVAVFVALGAIRSLPPAIQGNNSPTT